VASSDFTDALAPHYNDALRYCHALTARTARIEAEDILQEALLKALNHYDQLKTPSRFRVWFFQIITRTYLSERRKAYWKRILPFASGVMHMPDVYASVPLSDVHLALLDALAQLAPRQRAALLLFELAGFSLEEIRLIQGDRSLSAVKSRLSRARQKLKHIIQEDKNAASKNTSLSRLHHETIETTRKALDALHDR